MQSHVMRWIIPMIAGLIVVGIFLFWVMGQMQDLPVMYVGTNEEARFIRYLSCAAAMCGGWRLDDTDGCNSGEVISQPLEYENQVVVKGCKELCEELRDDPSRNNGVARERYCGRDFVFNFIFQDDVTYTADRTEGTNDLKRVHKWKGVFIHRDRCFDTCKDQRKGDEGWLYSYSPTFNGYSYPVNLCLDPRFDIIFGSFTSCEEHAESGSLWISEDFVNAPGNCVISGSYNFMSRSMPIIDGCTFLAGTGVDIWTEEIGSGRWWCWDVFGHCLSHDCGGLMPGHVWHACPQIIISVV